MEAIGVEPGGAQPRVVDVPRPDPEPGEALVRTLRVGVDGTDRGVIAGDHGSPPPGEDLLVLGHEAVGVVEAAPETGFERGDVVAPTIRRPPTDGENEYFERGEADMAPPDDTVERGIDGAHGFMSEYFTSPASSLVGVPDTLARWGFLVEPVSVVEKALAFARASRSSFDWSPQTALVLGNGSLGLLAVATLVERFDVYCLDRKNRPQPGIDIVERLGATYVDARETPVPAIPDQHGPADLIFEATGYAKHAFQSIEALAPNGVVALLGVPDSWRFEVDGGRLHEQLVLSNRALVGSVNSGPRQFRRAVDHLGSFPDWFPGSYVSRVVGVDSFPAAFETGDRMIKTAVEFDSP